MKRGALLVAALAVLATSLAWLAIPRALGAMAEKKAPDWMPAPGQERLLPGSNNDWEPALAVGPRGSVYVTAGRRRGSPRDKTTEFTQQILIWSSHDDGASFEGPFPVSSEGQVAADQRVAVDGKGVVYVSYLEVKKEGEKTVGLLQLARSADAGRTFQVQTITDKFVSDKPELVVSEDGNHVSLVYESRPGPRLISSHDAGKTWDEGRVVEQSEGRHFWPTGLALGPSGDLWFAVPSMSDAAIQKGEPTTVTLHVFRSSDRGETWRDADFGGSPRILGGCAHEPDCRVKVSSIGVAADGKGTAYVAYTQGTAKKPYTLFFKSSRDGGQTWTESQRLSFAARPQSADDADCDFVHVAAQGDGRVCVVWMDDRLGAKNVWGRCSADAARSWGAETLLSNRTDGAPYKSAEGFGHFYGHYGGVAIASSGQLHAAWPEGPHGEENGAVWVNSLDPAAAKKR